MDLERAMTYLEFVEERHRVWERRQAGEPGPWTSDPILSHRKFTNVFRVLDYGSQFVLTDLIDPELAPEDQLARLFLYRHTGRVDVWQYAKLMLGRYPIREDLDDVLKIWQSYRQGKPTSRPVFTNAYLVFPQSQIPGTDKLESIIDLTRRLFVSGTVAEVFLLPGTQRDKFEALRTNKGVADFMSMQILTDWGYTPHCGVDQENEFVILGPGARKGALAIAPTWKPERTLEWAVQAVRDSPDCPELPTLQTEHGNVGRLPSYMDVQNTLCEYSKHVRFAQKPTPAKPYQPAHPGKQPDPVLPEHWRKEPA